MWLPNLVVIFGAVKAMAPIAPGQPATPRPAMPPGFVAAALLAVLAWLLLYALCQSAITYGAFQGMRGRDIQIGEAFGRAVRRLLPVIGAVIAVGIAVAIGFILLVVPGMIFWTMFYVAVPVCVVERLGPVASLGRSRELTKGYRWRIFGLALLLVLISGMVLGIQKVLNVTVGGIPAIVGDGLLQVVFLAFQLIVYAVAYHDMRVDKEGIDIEQLASVFD
jgi:hypothetical protein